MKLAYLSTALLLALLLVSCDEEPKGVDLAILSGSENQGLESVIQEFARKNHYRITVDYQGSVDMALGMADPSFGYDAVWPAHSLWISLGDDKLKRVKRVESIKRSPVVFGIKKSLAQQLGFVGKKVSVGDLLAAVESGKLQFMMTNATQSNSGAIAYLGFLYSFLGQPDVITSQELDRPDLMAKMRKLLSAVNRSSGSSGWLRDLYLKSDLYSGMVNYEAMIIEANQQLVAQGREPLYAVYPVDGQAIADSPLGYVDKGDSHKEEVFSKLQEYLLSTGIQKEIQKQGWRTGNIGMNPASVDRSVFNPSWGIDTEQVINQIRLPQPDVLRKALDLYQVSFRKPSFTVFALDYSGSMQGDGESQLKSAMGMLLDQDTARRWMLQTGPDDVTVVIPFNSRSLATWQVTGNGSDKLKGLLRQIQSQQSTDGTDIYLPVIEGLRMMEKDKSLRSRYQPAVILMTDGKSNSDQNFRRLVDEWKRAELDVPVFGIMFGDADPDQLKTVADATRGQVFDGRKDLVGAFRTAKGYN